MGLVMEFTLYANYIPYTCARAGPATALPAECRAPAHEVGSPKMLGLNKSTVPNCGCHFMVICPVDMIKKLKKICRYTILPRVKIKVVPCLATSFAVVQVRKMAKKRGGGEVAAV